MAGNKSLGDAKIAKRDEFYTQLSDIERELKHYRRHFEGKIVLCNCDDPFESNFFKYFVLNFNKLGLKKLIATSYAGSPIAGNQLQYHADQDGQMTFSFEANPDRSDQHPYKAVVNTVYDKSGNDAVEMLDVAELFESGENELTELEGNGDFRSQECLDFLDEADIVVTNPPFSLFREYVKTLMDHHKKFIIIGNIGAAAYKEVFPLIKENEIWLGYGFANGNAYFSVTKDAVKNYAKGVYDESTGLVKFRNCCWFTNLDIKKRHEEIIPVKKYNSDEYPKYENYDAINVDAVIDIPFDYTGIMGVPVSFIDKYNPDQFEIIGLGSGYLGQSIGITGIPKEHKKMMKGHSAAGDLYYMKDGTPKVPYSRILIRYTQQWIQDHPEDFGNTTNE